MGFPVSELKTVETDPERPDAPPTVRITFMGLYGVDSPLPTGYIDDIAQKREGYEAQEAFLDIFNHRMMTQFTASGESTAIPPPLKMAVQINLAQHDGPDRHHRQQQCSRFAYTGVIARHGLQKVLPASLCLSLRIPE